MTTMSVDQFVTDGYLHELNRRFLHPLGLAMFVSCDDDGGRCSLGGLLDARDDPEGYVFDEDTLEPPKAANVARLEAERRPERVARLGHWVQPVGHDPATDPDPATTRDAMRDFVEARTTNLLKYPDGWGPPHAVELQLLLLVEMAHVLRGAPQTTVDEVSHRYAGFLGHRYPGDQPTFLAARLGLELGSTDEFVSALREFLEQERAL